MAGTLHRGQLQPRGPRPPGPDHLHRPSSQPRSLPAYLLAATLVLMFNPFVALPTSVRFGGIGLLSVAAIAFTTGSGQNPFRGLPRIVHAYAIVVGLAALRIRDLADPSAGSVRIQVVQHAMTVIVMYAAVIVVRSTGWRVYARALLLFSGLVAAYLAFRSPQLVDRGSGQFGDFNFSTYQDSGQIFGVAILTALGLRWQDKLTTRDIPRLLVGVILLLFAVQFRGRGETIGLLVAIGAMRYPRTSIIAAIPLVVFPGILVNLIGSISLPAFDRLARTIEDRSFGGRAELITLAWDDLSDSMTLLLGGGGSNYFQWLHGFNFGSYPHNWMLELWISGGILAFFVGLAMFARPVLARFGRSFGFALDRDSRYFLGMCVFLLVLISKSGSFTTGWFVSLFIPFFVFEPSAVERRPVTTTVR